MKIHIVKFTKIDPRNGCFVKTHKGFLNKKDAVSFESKVRRGLIEGTMRDLKNRYTGEQFTYSSIIEKNIPANNTGILDAINFNIF